MAINNKNKGLGRGLDAIFSAEGSSLLHAIPSAETFEMVDITLVIPNPKQPRQDFEQEALEELSESIKALGVIQPITVKKEGGKYIIISGERRWRASQMAGLKRVPVYIRDVSDNTILEMAIVENIQRQDLNAMEIAMSFQRLVDECNLSQEELADRVGKKRSTVTNYLRLLKLPGELQLALREGLISMGHARALIGVENRKTQLQLLKKIIAKQLSVREVESMVARLTDKPATKTTVEDEYPESYTALVECLEKIFSQDISIKRSNNGGGKIVIGYSSDKDIESILKRLEKI